MKTLNQVTFALLILGLSACSNPNNTVKSGAAINRNPIITPGAPDGGANKDKKDKQKVLPVSLSTAIQGLKYKVKGNQVTVAFSFTDVDDKHFQMAAQKILLTGTIDSGKAKLVDATSKTITADLICDSKSTDCSQSKLTINNSSGIYKGSTIVDNIQVTASSVSPIYADKKSSYAKKLQLNIQDAIEHDVVDKAVISQSSFEDNSAAASYSIRISFKKNEKEDYDEGSDFTDKQLIISGVMGNGVDIRMTQSYKLVSEDNPKPLFRDNAQSIKRTGNVVYDETAKAVVIDLAELEPFSKLKIYLSTASAETVGDEE